MSSWLEGDVLFSVGIASNVKTEEEGRNLSYKNGVSEIEKYIHVSNLGCVPIETQMTHTEILKDGRFNVYRLLKADKNKLFELKNAQLEEDAEINRLKQREADRVKMQRESFELKKQKIQGNLSGEDVVFNFKSKTYHCSKCRWAVKCKKSCTQIPLSEALKLNGIPCKACGGICGSK